MTVMEIETNTSVVGVACTQHPSTKEYSLGVSHVGTDAAKGTLRLENWKAATA